MHRHMPKKCMLGKYPCRCGNPSKLICGMTVDHEKMMVTHFWCKDCGGAFKPKGDIEVNVRPDSVNEQGNIVWKVDSKNY